MIYLQIYLLGVLIALFFIYSDFIAFCKKNNVDYRYALNDKKILFNIILSSLGSWIIVLFYIFHKNE